MMLKSFFILPFLFACQEDSTTVAPSENSEQTVTTSEIKKEHKYMIKDQASVQFVGTILFKNLEGGFWAIDADNGQHFLPLNLAPELQKAGLRVEISAVKKEVMTIANYGFPIEIQSVNVIGQIETDGKATH